MIFFHNGLSKPADLHGTFWLLLVLEGIGILHEGFEFFTLFWCHFKEAEWQNRLMSPFLEEFRDVCVCMHGYLWGVNSGVPQLESHHCRQDSWGKDTVWRTACIDSFCSSQGDTHLTAFSPSVLYEAAEMQPTAPPWKHGNVWYMPQHVHSLGWSC